MKGSLVGLPLHYTLQHRTDHLLLHFHAIFTMMLCASPSVVPLPVLRQNWETLARPASWCSKSPDVNACPHTVFIHPSVSRHKPTNLLPLGFEAQTKKLSQWFWGQITEKLSPPVLRLNQKTHASRLLHVYDADHTRRHSTSRSSGHWVPDLCLIIPDPPHQVSYSCLHHHRCTPCCIRHLHITRQANTFLHNE
jgi:hypothetical protein